MFKVSNTSTKVLLLITGLLWMILMPSRGVGQAELDPLKAAVLQSTDSMERFQLLDSFARKVFTIDIDTFIKYNEIFIDLALELKEYDAAVSASGRMAYSYNRHKNDLKTAIDFIEAIRPYEDSLKTTYSRGAIYSSLGGIYFSGDQYEKAIEQYDKALERFGKKDSLFIADMYLFKAQAFGLSGQFLPSIQNSRKAYQIYEAKGDTTYMIEVLAELADIYSRNGLYDKAIAEYLLSDSLSRQHNFPHRLFVNAFNAATTYKKMGNTKQQLDHLEKALQLFPTLSMPNYEQQFTLWCTMVIYHSKAGTLVEAKSFLDSAEVKSDFHTGSALTQGAYLQAKLAYMLATEQWTEALPFLHQLLNLTENWKDYEMRMDALDYAAQFYHVLGDSNKAWTHLTAYHELKDSIFEKNNQNQLLYYQTAFEAERKEKILHQQKSEIQQIQKERDATERLMIIAMTGSGLVFGIMFLIHFWRRSRREKRLQEDFASRLIEQQENENKRISENLHDGLGQSLLLIKNQVILNKDEGAQKMVDQAIAEVNSISKALHPLQLEQLGLTEAIRTNISTLDQNSEIFFSADLEYIDNLFPKTKIVNIYRIVQEVLSNVVKHSGAQACRVELKKLQQQVLLVVQDNGRGFEFTSEYEKIGSLGLKTLRSRVQQLKGQLLFDTKKGSGTLVKIMFPINPV